MKASKQIDTQVHDLNLKGDYKAQFLGDNIKHTTENKEHNLKSGDVIEFWAGYNNDIRFKSTIHGFDENGKAYVNWDCYWFPIDLNDLDRDYKKV